MVSKGSAGISGVFVYSLSLPHLSLDLYILPALRMGNKPVVGNCQDILEHLMFGSTGSGSCVKKFYSSCHPFRVEDSRIHSEGSSQLMACYIASWLRELYRMQQPSVKMTISMDDLEVCHDGLVSIAVNVGGGCSVVLKLSKSIKCD